MTHRNDICQCRSHRPTKFCLCSEPRTLLCNECRKAHFEDLEKADFHDLYPYEMIEVYERLGREGLTRRKEQLIAARSTLDSLKELEAREYAIAAEALTEARLALDLIHRSLLDLFGQSLDFLQQTLMSEVVVEAEGLSGYVVAVGQRPQTNAAFTQMYNVQTVLVVREAFIRLSAEALEDQLVDLLSVDKRVQVSSSRLKRAVTHKLLPNRSAYMTPRRSMKPKLSPYNPSFLLKSSKRKNSAHRDFHNSSSSHLLPDRPDDSLLHSEALLESYHSPSVLARASGKNSRVGKNAEELLSSFERSFAKKKHPSDAGVIRKAEDSAGLGEYLDSIPSVIRKTIRLQRKLGKAH